jgi:hypothetical protein
VPRSRLVLRRVFVEPVPSERFRLSVAAGVLRRPASAFAPGRVPTPTLAAVVDLGVEVLPRLSLHVSFMPSRAGGLAEGEPGPRSQAIAGHLRYALARWSAPLQRLLAELRLSLGGGLYLVQEPAGDRQLVSRPSRRGPKARPRAACATPAATSSPSA